MRKGFSLEEKNKIRNKLIPKEAAEEYLARTDIENVDQAKKYLNQLKMLFWVVFLSMFIFRFLGESEDELFTEIILLFFIPYLILIVYFIYFCSKLLKLEKISRWNAIWCVFFAPFSWFYLYPLIANPLKIIVGEKQAPMYLSDAERIQEEAIRGEKFWKRLFILVSIFGFIVIMLLIWE